MQVHGFRAKPFDFWRLRGTPPTNPSLSATSKYYKIISVLAFLTRPDFSPPSCREPRGTLSILCRFRPARGACDALVTCFASASGR
jgi:hypothetical protein